MNTPLFSHRHYVKIAEIIANLPQPERTTVAFHFAKELKGTNSAYNSGRFYAAAIGCPTGRDKP